MNTTVTATGMQVKAVTNANLYIKEGLIDDASTITGTQATMSNTIHTLAPAELTDAAGTVTVKVPDTWTDEPTVNSAGSGATWTTKGTFTATTNTATLATTATDGIGNYIAGETMTLVRKAQTDAVSVYDVDAVVTVSLGATSDLNKAIYCGFLVGTTFTQTAADTPAASGDITFTFTDLLDNIADNVVQKVTFVLWYEGEDAYCTSNNAIVVSTNTVEIVFTSRAHS